MYILYIDESGDTIPLSQKGKNYLVLTGMAVEENNLPRIYSQLRSIKKKYYQNEFVEFKSSFVRYANPDIPKTKSPLRLHQREQYNQLEADLNQFLQDIEVILFSIVIDKREYWNKYPSQDPYNITYVFLLERFQKFLAEKKAYGITVIDPREGQVEKHYMGNQLHDIHERMRRADGKIWDKCENIVEKLLFSESDKTEGIQIVDMYCYPVFHIFEYGKSPSEYWRFKEQTFPKLQRVNNKLLGYGLKIFPETKKDLSIFET